MDRINAQGFSQGPAAEIGPRIESALARGETVTLQISGDSMRPTLKPRRDAAVLEPLQTWPPRRGEILFFRRANGEYVLHRVLRLTPEGPIMNGDAQGWTEGPVPRAQVLARASGLLRNGQAARYPAGRVSRVCGALASDPPGAQAHVRLLAGRQTPAGQKINGGNKDCRRL